MDKAGVVPKETSERLKIQLGYPACYFDKPIPLSPAGQKGVKWLAENEAASLIPDEEMARCVGLSMLFGKYGIEFFDKKRIVQEIREERPEFHSALIWEHANVIDWLRNPANRDFESRGIITELRSAVDGEYPIYSPHRRFNEGAHNRYVLSPHRAAYQKRGDKFRRRKLKKAGLDNDLHLEQRRLEEGLYKKY